MQWLAKFVLSEGTRYRELQLATDTLSPRKAEGSKEDGLDGWGFLMRTEKKDFGLLYFENKAAQATSSGWKPNTTYDFRWYDPRTGEWQAAVNLTADAKGDLQLPAFPGGMPVADKDWAAKITQP